jgi:hypothetical protein
MLRYARGFVREREESQCPVYFRKKRTVQFRSLLLRPHDYDTISSTATQPLYAIHCWERQFRGRRTTGWAHRTISIGCSALTEDVSTEVHGRHLVPPAQQIRTAVSACYEIVLAARLQPAQHEGGSVSLSTMSACHLRGLSSTTKGVGYYVLTLAFVEKGSFEIHRQCGMRTVDKRHYPRSRICSLLSAPCPTGASGT